MKPRLNWIIGIILFVAGVILLLGVLWISRDPSSSERAEINDSAPPLLDAESLRIHPGEGIGRVSFGASRADIINAFGDPSVSKKSNGFDTMEYPDLGFWVLCHEEKGFLQFNGFSASRARVIHGNVAYAGRTRDGVGIGSTKSEVEDAMGKPLKGYETDAWGYRSPRISFDFEQDKVIGIGMLWDFRPGA